MKRLVFFFAFTSIIAIFGTKAQTYHEDDKEGLRIFLRQPSSEEGKINAEQLGLQISDTLDWQNSEAWIKEIYYFRWNDNFPKRLIEIYVGMSPICDDDCFSKNLSGTLDASKFSELTTLKCDYNQLTALDLSANTALTELECSFNQLTTLDLRANTALDMLSCGWNQLTTLDVSANTALTGLHCRSNQLTALDVRTNTKLFSLDCSDNHLSALDLSVNLELEWLECYNNHLQLSNLFLISEIKPYQHSQALGTQTLPARTVGKGSEIDYSDQKVFKGINTQFSVTENGFNVPDAYSLIDGKITFYKTGNYTLTMTNKAITYNPPYYPAEVIVEITVSEADNAIIPQNAKQIKIFPNPAHDQLQITNLNSQMAEYCIYGVAGHLVMQGRVQGENTTLNVSGLASGVYYLRISDEVVKFVKQ